jgi:hypothetical protein
MLRQISGLRYTHQNKVKVSNARNNLFFEALPHVHPMSLLCVSICGNTQNCKCIQLEFRKKRPLYQPIFISAKSLARTAGILRVCDNPWSNVSINSDGGNFGHVLWNVTRQNKNTSAFIKQGACTVNVLCQLQVKYKVVQIWPGQTVTCLHTNSPGHIWTTLY